MDFPCNVRRTHISDTCVVASVSSLSLSLRITERTDFGITKLPPRNRGNGKFVILEGVSPFFLPNRGANDGD